MKKEEKIELEIDQSQLSEEQKAEQGFHFPWFWLIIAGVIIILMVVCIIVINLI